MQDIRKAAYSYPLLDKNRNSLWLFVTLRRKKFALKMHKLSEKMMQGIFYVKFTNAAKTLLTNGIFLFFSFFFQSYPCIYYFCNHDIFQSISPNVFSVS